MKLAYAMVRLPWPGSDSEGYGQVVMICLLCRGSRAI